MNTYRVAVIGAGDHAHVVASTLLALGHHVVGFYDDDPQKWGKKFLNVPVAGPISELTPKVCSHAIIGIGNNELRKRLAEQIDIDWLTAVHPFSWVHPGVQIGKGTFICAGATVMPEAKIGSHVILNVKAGVDHNCTIGNYVHISVAHLGGGASADEGAFLATGSIVIPGVHVGAWAIVGAGAVVFQDVAPRTTVVGNPARPLPSFPVREKQDKGS